MYALVPGPGRPYFSATVCPESRLGSCTMSLLFTTGDRTKAYVLTTVSQHICLYWLLLATSI